jgi:hypothetical protein
MRVGESISAGQSERQQVVRASSNRMFEYDDSVVYKLRQAKLSSEDALSDARSRAKRDTKIVEKQRKGKNVRAI